MQNEILTAVNEDFKELEHIIDETALKLKEIKSEHLEEMKNRISEFIDSFHEPPEFNFEDENTADEIKDEISYLKSRRQNAAVILNDLLETLRKTEAIILSLSDELSDFSGNLELSGEEKVRSEILTKNNILLEKFRIKILDTHFNNIKNLIIGMSDIIKEEEEFIHGAIRDYYNLIIELGEEIEE